MRMNLSTKATQLGENLLKKVNKTVKDEQMIDEGDNVLVAVSGGKDSLALLTLLALYQAKSKAKYNLFAVNIQTDYHRENSAPQVETLRDIFEAFEIPYEFDDIEITKDEKGREKTPSCFWCAWNRRKAIFFVAKRLNCNKIAYGHNLDDIAQTALMNLFYHGETKPMFPKQTFFDGIFTVIRPMAFIPEKEIADFSRACQFDVPQLKCDVANTSKREKMRDIIDSFGNDKEMIMVNILRAVGLEK